MTQEAGALSAFLQENLLAQPIYEAFERLFVTRLPIEDLRQALADWHGRYEALKSDHERQALALAAVTRDRDDLEAKLSLRARQQSLSEQWRAEVADFHEHMAAFRELEAAYQAARDEVLTLVREREEQATERMADAASLVTAARWHARCAYLLAFLPRLPQHVLHPELCALLGGTPLPPFASPFHPMSEGGVAIKRAQYLALPPDEQDTVRHLCLEIHRQYGIELHHIAHSLLKA